MQETFKSQFTKPQLSHLLTFFTYNFDQLAPADCVSKIQAALTKIRYAT